MSLTLLKSLHSGKESAGSTGSDIPRATVSLEEVVVSYDSRFSLHCPGQAIHGNVIAVVGHNGAGKSTLLKAILNLLPLKRGHIELTLRTENGSRVLSPSHDLAFCPEMGSVFSDISVESYIKLWCRLRHRNPRYYVQEGAKYIELLNIGPLLDRLGRELSKGQRRRVQTAIGFFMRPKLFLLDEPFDGLDVQKTHELAEIIEQHRSQMSFIISSHRMDVIERLADTIVVLNHGGILAVGSVEEVCAALAPHSLRFTCNEGSEKAARLLRTHFPSLFVSKIGNMVTITGNGLHEGLINSLLAAHQISVHHQSLEQSTLVDAMNYHLRKTSLPPEV